MKSFEHHDAASLEQALELLGRYEGQARPMAGGSDLLGALKEGILPQHPTAPDQPEDHRRPGRNRSARRRRWASAPWPSCRP